MITLCDQCGQAIGTPHTLLDTDCILGHTDHAERFAGYACRRHYHWIDRTLLEIAKLFTMVADVIEPGPGGDTRSATRTGSPSPGRIEVMALTDWRGLRDWIGDDDAIPDLPGALNAWVRILHEERPKLDLNGYDGTLAASVRVLRRQRTWIVQQSWLDDYTSELADLHRAVSRAVGDTMWPKPIGKCPNCTHPLFHTIGVDEVTCRRCGSAWAGVALARLRLIHEQDQNGRVEPREEGASV